MPRCGRSHIRNSAQHPSIVFTWTSQTPSPSSSRANPPRPWLPLLWAYLQPGRRAYMLYSSVYIRVPDMRVSWIKGSMVFGWTWALRLITPCPPRWIIPKTGGRSGSHVPRLPCPLSRRRRLLLGLHSLRRSFRADHHIGCVALPLVGQRHRWLFLTIPWRPGGGRWCTSLRSTASAGARGALDRCKPRQYNHRIPTLRGGGWPANMVSVSASKRG